VAKVIDEADSNAIDTLGIIGFNCTSKFLKKENIG